MTDLEFEVDTIKKILSSYENYDSSDGINERVYIYPEILEEILFSPDISLSIDDLRKLDLSCVDFTGKDIEGCDFSYTNVNIDPQTVLNKSLRMANLEGIDLSGRDFTDVFVRGTNLKNTGAVISIKDLHPEYEKYENSYFVWDSTLEDTILDGCFLLKDGLDVSPLMVRIKYGNVKIIDNSGKKIKIKGKK